MGKGGTSHAYDTPGSNGRRVTRLTMAEEWDARRLDEFGRYALEKLVDTRLVRVARRYASYEVTSSATEYFQRRGLRSVEINEKLPLGTADKMMAEQPGGVLTKRQRLALDQALRELNRRGLAWLDGKADNYGFERLPGKDRWRVIVIDPGGIVAMRGNTPFERYINARNLQRLINRPTAEQMEVWDNFENAREMVRNEIRFKIREQFGALIDRQAMGLPENGRIAFTPQAGLRLRGLAREFDLNPETANQNYLDHYGSPPQVAANR